MHERKPLFVAIRRKPDTSLQLFTKGWLNLFWEMLKMTRGAGYILLRTADHSFCCGSVVNQPIRMQVWSFCISWNMKIFFDTYIYIHVIKVRSLAKYIYFFIYSTYQCVNYRKYFLGLTIFLAVLGHKYRPFANFLSLSFATVATCLPYSLHYTTIYL
jgi:hypothetical protein